MLSSGDGDVGLANVTKHTTNLTNDTPIYQRPCRFPPPIADEIERQGQELNSLDIIEPSMVITCCACQEKERHNKNVHRLLPIEQSYNS